MQRRLWMGTGVLMVAAYMLIGHAYDLSMWYDELWSVFHSSNTLDQFVIRDVDLPWPPGYYVLLHGWMALFGRHDLVLKMMQVFLAMLGVAFTIRAGQILESDRAGWLAGIALAVSSYATAMLLELRGYSQVLVLAPLVIWFHARWLKRPTWRRAVLYVVAQTLLLYMRFVDTAVIVGLLGLRVLLVEPRRFVRWLAVMAATGVLMAPLLPQLWDLYQYRRGVHVENPDPNIFMRGPEEWYQAYSGHQDTLWAVILLLASVGVGLWLWRQRDRATWGTAICLVSWGLGIPLGAYAFREELLMYTARYLTFTIPAFMLLIGIGLARLPRWGTVVGACLLLVFLTLPWRPFDFRRRYTNSPPVRDLVRELAVRFEPGDVLLVDPRLRTMEEPFDWWYYEGLYFPWGRIPRVNSVDKAGPRLWYLVRQGKETPGLADELNHERIATEFWGPWYFIVTLYEGPPLTPGVRMGESAIHFRGQTLPTGTLYHPNDTLTVETWWSVDGPVERDYSIGLHLIDSSGNLIAQTDSGPTGSYTPGATSAWQPGQIYRDDRSLKIPQCIEDRTLDLQLVVYGWWDGKILSAENSEAGSVSLDTITVGTYSMCH
jgi:hypothetical protein